MKTKIKRIECGRTDCPWYSNLWLDNCRAASEDQMNQAKCFPQSIKALAGRKPAANGIARNGTRER